MIRRLTALLPAFLLTLPYSTHSQVGEAVLVSVEALEVKGEANPERASAISKDLAVLIEGVFGIDVVTSNKDATAPSQYLLKGSLHAGGGRHFVGLQLLDTKSRKLVWSENYDYTNISTDMMANDVVSALHSASAKDR